MFDTNEKCLVTTKKSVKILEGKISCCVRLLLTKQDCHEKNTNLAKEEKEYKKYSGVRKNTKDIKHCSGTATKCWRGRV